MADEQRHTVKIEYDVGGYGHVWIDGQEIFSVRRVVLDMHPRRVVLSLDLEGVDVRVDGEAHQMLVTRSTATERDRTMLELRTEP